MSTGKKYSTVFRLSVVLKETVNPDILKEAVISSLEKYQIYKVKLKPELFWYYLEENSKEPIIEEEIDYSCKHINSKKNNNYLFKVTYFNNKINIDIFHALTDGNGGTIFFKEIIYTWITVMYSIKSGNNIAGHVFIQTVLISIVTIYIDKSIGFTGCSIYIANPITLITANSTMSILTMISHKKYIKYAIYQLIIVLISMFPIILFLKNIMELKLLNNISIGVSIFNLIISLILCYKDIKDEIIRKFHM